MTSNKISRKPAPPRSPHEPAGKASGQRQPLPARAREFRGLGPADRALLARWLVRARDAGIDAAEDLAERPWPQPNANTIIGLFKPGQLLASWLLVEESGRWAVACCADGAVSPPLDSLAEALAWVCA